MMRCDKLLPTVATRQLIEAGDEGDEELFNAMRHADFMPQQYRSNPRSS